MARSPEQASCYSGPSELCTEKIERNSWDHDSAVAQFRLETHKNPRADQSEQQPHRRYYAPRVPKATSHVQLTSPNGWRVSGERRAKGDERARRARVLGGGAIYPS